jgi:hypothetical protein
MNSILYRENRQGLLGPKEEMKSQLRLSHFTRKCNGQTNNREKNNGNILFTRQILCLAGINNIEYKIKVRGIS